jgi:hypothetical protein
MIEKMIKHFCTITKHKYLVLKLCIKAGIPWRGIVHDLSKYSPTEFFESVKYYQGKFSPIAASKRENGYSKAWLHHKGRNKHHAEYWNDPRAIIQNPVIPYKYAIEMICDTLAAGMVYNKKDWTNSTQLEYWNRDKEKNVVIMNEKIMNLLTEVYTLISINGIDRIINKKTLKGLYNKHCNMQI